MKKGVGLGLVAIVLLIVAVIFALYIFNKDSVLQAPPISGSQGTSGQGNRNPSTTPVCGDGQCQVSETLTSCSADCYGFSGASYIDHNGLQLKYISSTYSSNGAINTRSPVTLDGATNVISFNAMAIGSDGNPVITYYDSNTGDLKIGFCSNRFCSPNGFTSKTLYTASGNPARWPAISINSQGNPVVAFGNGASVKELDIITCLDKRCVNTQTEYVGTNTLTSLRGTSLMMGANGFPQVAYITQDNAGLKQLQIVSCQDVACSSASPPIEVDIDTDVREVSMVLGTDNNPFLLYTKEIPGNFSASYDLMTYHCVDTACSTIVNPSPYDSAPAGVYEDKKGIDLMLNIYGNPIFSYFVDDGFNTVLRVGNCNDAGCLLPNSPQALNSVPLFYGDAPFSSITFGGLGIGSAVHPTIFYRDGEQGGLKVVSCFDQLCAAPSSTLSLDSTPRTGYAVSADSFV